MSRLISTALSQNPAPAQASAARAMPAAFCQGGDHVHDVGIVDQRLEAVRVAFRHEQGGAASASSSTPTTARGCWSPAGGR